MVVLPPRVAEKLELLPSSPGVYLFRDRRGAVLYVGKARHLRSRVRSYFLPGASDDRFFVTLLEEQIGDLETLVVQSEKEAALLENQLIKEHRPRYNIKLRDDKDFLSLRLDAQADWSRLEVVRRPRPDGARYFGPYHSATAARQTLRLVNRFFQLRTCTDAELHSRRRPCLQYQIKRCPGPCAKDVDRQEYGRQVAHVALFLDGRHDELVGHLETQMGRAAERTEYERAAVFRDQLRAVDRVREEQRVATVRDVDQDVIGLHRQADQAEVAVLMVRSGKLVGVRTYDLDDVGPPDDEVLSSFVGEYYAEGAFLPQEVILPAAVEAMGGLEALLSDRRGARVRVLVPKRGPRARLVAMATENAAHAFREKRRAERDVEERLGQLMKRLDLPRLPRRIECIDISHSAGQDTVAAIVALEGAVPDRKRYRSFHVKGARAGDDYGAMFEVLSRRFRRGRGEEPGWALPDLLVVDGGRGQLNVARAALEDLGVADLPIVALAKERESATGDRIVERVYLPGVKNAIPVREGNAALRVLLLARDEAHRAANALRLKLGKRRHLRSELDSIPGVGKVTRARLLSAIGSIEAIRGADEETLVRAGASRSQARQIRLALGIAAPEATATQEGVLGEDEATDADDAERVAVDNAFVTD